MKQKDVLQGAAEILGLQENNYAILRRCANLVLANIAANYRDCVATQSFSKVFDGKIEYKDFEKPFLKVKNIKVNGEEAGYSLFIDFLQVRGGGKVEVIYCYVPSYTDNLDHEIRIPNLSKETFIYGVITEYALISGMFNEAKVWNEKFEVGLFGTSPKNGLIRIPAERW